MRKYYTVEINKQISSISVATFLGNYESISEAKEAAFPKMYDEDLLIGFDMDKEPEFTDEYGFHTVDMSLAHEDEIVVLKRTDCSLEDIPEDLFYWSDDVQETTYYKADGTVWESFEMQNDEVGVLKNAEKGKQFVLTQKGYVEEVPYKPNNTEKIKQGSPSKKKVKDDYER